MNKTTIIGNLVRDPELRTLNSGVNVCTFTVAVNRRRKAEGQPEADFFRVSAWRQLGETCEKYLTKGRKVAVTGSIEARAYQGSDGQPKASLELTADDVEFLSSRNEQGETTASEPTQTGYTEVTSEDMPF
jgi:single-strand DNA-binding protein